MLAGAGRMVAELLAGTTAQRGSGTTRPSRRPAPVLQRHRPAVEHRPRLSGRTRHREGPRPRARRSPGCCATVRGKSSRAKSSSNSGRCVRRGVPGAGRGGHKRPSLTPRRSPHQRTLISSPSRRRAFSGACPQEAVNLEKVVDAEVVLPARTRGWRKRWLRTSCCGRRPVPLECGFRVYSPAERAFLVLTEPCRARGASP